MAGAADLGLRCLGTADRQRRDGGRVREARPESDRRRRMGDSVMSSNVVFQEADAQRRVESAPMSHLSIELGHLYAEDFGPGNDRLNRYFDRVAGWVEAIRHDCQAQLPQNTKARVS